MIRASSVTPSSVTPSSVSPSSMAPSSVASPFATPVATAWHPVARVDEVTARAGTPCPVRLLGHDLVAITTEPDGGGIAVLHGRCPHRGTLLSLGAVEDGCVSCPYHGWRFDGSGRCVHIPSLPDGPIPHGAHLPPVATAVRHGLVWCHLDADADPAGIPWFPAADDDPAMRLVDGPPMTWRTSAGRHLENILDLAHFPFVHPSTFGCEEARIVHPHEVDVSDTSGGPPVVSASVRVVTRNPSVGDGLMYPELGPTIELGYHYEVRIPYRITLRFDFPDGMRRELHEVISPVGPDECRIHWRLCVDRRLTSTDDEERAFAHAVFAEDQPIVESQPAGVPVAATAELHLPSDRLAVAYRLALRRAGAAPHDRV